MNHFDKTLQKLGFFDTSKLEEPLLMKTDDTYQSKLYVRQQIKLKAKQLGASAVYTRYDAIQGVYTPQLLIFDNTTETYTPDDLASIHRQVWSSAFVQVYYIVNKETVTVLDATYPYSLDGEMVLSVINPLSEKESSDRYHAENFNNGIFWNCPQNNESFLHTNGVIQTLERETMSVSRSKTISRRDVVFALWEIWLKANGVTILSEDSKVHSHETIQRFTDQDNDFWSVFDLSFVQVESIVQVSEFLLENREKPYRVPLHLAKFMINSLMPLDTTKSNSSVLDLGGSSTLLCLAFRQLLDCKKQENIQITTSLLDATLNQLHSTFDNDDLLDVSLLGLHFIAQEHGGDFNIVNRLPNNFRVNNNDLIDNEFECTRWDGKRFDVVMGNLLTNKRCLSVVDLSTCYLVNHGGLFSVILPNKRLLSNEQRSKQFRKQVLMENKVHYIFDLTLHSDPIYVPPLFYGKQSASILALSPKISEDGEMEEVQEIKVDENVFYIAVRPTHASLQRIGFDLSKHNNHYLPPHAVIDDPIIWKSVLFGGGSLYFVLKRLMEHDKPVSEIPIFPQDTSAIEDLLNEATGQGKNGEMILDDPSEFCDLYQKKFCESLNRIYEVDGNKFRWFDTVVTPATICMVFIYGDETMSPDDETQSVLNEEREFVSTHLTSDLYKPNTIYLVRPKQYKYWSASAAYNDVGHTMNKLFESGY